MVLLLKLAALSGQEVISAWRRLWPGDSVPTQFEGDSDALTAGLGSATLAAGSMPGPIPETELAGPAQTSWLWPGAQSKVRNHKGHIVLWVSGAGGPIDNSRMLTHFASSVIEATGAMGVYWGSASQLIKSEVFVALARQYDRSVPVMLWADFRCRRDPDGTFSLFTVGLGEFGLMEMEVEGSLRPPGQLREFVWNLAIYQLQSKTLIRDGDTVGGSELQKFLIREARSFTGRDSNVFRIDGL